MRSTHPIDSFLGSRSRILVLRVLNGVAVPLNVSQIAAHAGLSKPAASTALAELASIGLVDSNPVGRSVVHWLVRENVYVERIVTPAFREEQEIADLLLEEIRHAFADSAVSVVLFGSYARGEQTDTSDVDVAIIAVDPEAKQELERRTDIYAPTFRRRFGATFSPLVYDLDEAASLWQRAPQLQETLEREGIVVSGSTPREWRGDAQR